MAAMRHVPGVNDVTYSSFKKIVEDREIESGGCANALDRLLVVRRTAILSYRELKVCELESMRDRDDKLTAIRDLQSERFKPRFRCGNGSNLRRHDLTRRGLPADSAVAAACCHA